MQFSHAVKAKCLACVQSSGIAMFSRAGCRGLHLGPCLPLKGL